jgi:DNA-binding NarL/FixJ family response regulator
VNQPDVEPVVLIESDSAAPPHRAIRVLLVDDHVLLRKGLEGILSLETDICVIGQAASGSEALTLAAALVPDIILLDVNMPCLGGLEACRMLHASVPSSRIVMFTASEDEADLFAAIKAGASGYLLKTTSPQDVAQAVRSVASGQSLISPSMAGKLLHEFLHLARHQSATTAAGPKLTARELEVLQLISRGMANREIGRSLFISENTVKNHVRNMLEKLHLHSRMEAVLYAVKDGLVTLDH